jgi:hypothetical protein
MERGGEAHGSTESRKQIVDDAPSAHGDSTSGEGFSADDFSGVLFPGNCLRLDQYGGARRT